MAGKMRWIYALALLIVLCQIIDGLTTYWVLSSDTTRQDDNPVVAKVFDSFGLKSGVSAIKTISAGCVLWVLLRVKRDKPRSVNTALACLAIASVLMVYVACNNIVVTALHMNMGVLKIPGPE